MNMQLVEKLELALNAYRGDLPTLGVYKEKRDGMEMISGTVQRLIDALEREDVDSAKLEVLTFSRQASDVYFEQPASFRNLAKLVGKIRKEIV